MRKNVMLNPADGGTSNKTCAEFISVSNPYETLKRVQGDKKELRHTLQGGGDIFLFSKGMIGDFIRLFFRRTGLRHVTCNPLCHGGSGFLPALSHFPYGNDRKNLRKGDIEEHE